MSAQNPSSFVEWAKNLPIPWLFGGPNGELDAASWPAVLDGQVTTLKDAVKARFPSYAPTDALPHIGGDRLLLQGASETNPSFITRLKSAWDDWARAGTQLELLAQLYWIGFPGAVIVQQNGLAYSLSGAPTAGADPTPLLTVTNLSTIGTALTPYPTYVEFAAGKSTGFYTKHIPAGASSQWWTFDYRTDFCSRFAVLFPSTGGLIAGDGSIAAADVARMGQVIRTWRRASQTCVGVYVLTSGAFWGWPVETWGSGGNWGPSSVVTVNGTWQ